MNRERAFNETIIDRRERVVELAVNAYGERDGRRPGARWPCPDRAAPPRPAPMPCRRARWKASRGTRTAAGDRRSAAVGTWFSTTCMNQLRSSWQRARSLSMRRPALKAITGTKPFLPFSSASAAIAQLERTGLEPKTVISAGRPGRKLPAPIVERQRAGRHSTVTRSMTSRNDMPSRRKTLMTLASE